jgi:hypothetical protein
VIQLAPHCPRGKRSLVNNGRYHPAVQQLSDQYRLCLIKPNGALDRCDAIVNDELLVTSSRILFTDAARVLVGRGRDTKSILILRRFELDTNCLIDKVGIAAKQATTEPDRGRAHFSFHKPLLSSPVAPSIRNSHPTGVAVSSAGAAR